MEKLEAAGGGEFSGENMRVEQAMALP